MQLNEEIILHKMTTHKILRRQLHAHFLPQIELLVPQNMLMLRSTLISFVLIRYALGAQNFLVPLGHVGSGILNSCRIINRQLFLSFYLVWREEGYQKFWILLEPWTDSRFCPVRRWGSAIMNPFRRTNRWLFCSDELWTRWSEFLNRLNALGIRNPEFLNDRQLSLFCILTRGVRNSEYFQNYK